MEKIKVTLAKLIVSLVSIPLFIAGLSLMALFAGGLMKIFGFRYQSVGSILMFFLISSSLAYFTKWFLKVISKVLFSHFKKIKVFESWIMLVALNTFFIMIMMSLTDFFMKSVSATPIALFVISLVIAIEKKGQKDKSSSDLPEEQ